MHENDIFMHKGDIFMHEIEDFAPGVIFMDNWPQNNFMQFSSMKIFGHGNFIFMHENELLINA